MNPTGIFLTGLGLGFAAGALLTARLFRHYGLVRTRAEYQAWELRGAPDEWGGGEDD